jgi:hypothetical protein
MPRRSEAKKVVAAAVLLAAFLGGCSDLYWDRRETVSFAASDAVKSALATQTIDPWPAASADRNVLTNGVVMSSAVERYRTCQIIQPKGTSTSAGYGNAPQSTQPGCTPAPAAASSSVKP